ncbi:hypothetical protein SNEBB_002623 [Seison nebaliae]|nr:hypothetical protein SNEBB_002623 [Seison nebaliae]
MHQQTGNDNKNNLKHENNSNLASSSKQRITSAYQKLNTFPGLRKLICTNKLNVSSTKSKDNKLTNKKKMQEKNLHTFQKQKLRVVRCLTQLKDIRQQEKKKDKSLMQRISFVRIPSTEENKEDEVFAISNDVPRNKNESTMKKRQRPSSQQQVRSVTFHNEVDVVHHDDIEHYDSNDPTQNGTVKLKRHYSHNGWETKQKKLPRSRRGTYSYSAERFASPMNYRKTLVRRDSEILRQIDEHSIAYHFDYFKLYLNFPNQPLNPTSNVDLADPIKSLDDKDINNNILTSNNKFDLEIDQSSSSIHQIFNEENSTNKEVDNNSLHQDDNKFDSDLTKKINEILISKRKKRSVHYPITHDTLSEHNHHHFHHHQHHFHPSLSTVALHSINHHNFDHHGYNIHKHKRRQRRLIVNNYSHSYQRIDEEEEDHLNQTQEEQEIDVNENKNLLNEKNCEEEELEEVNGIEELIGDHYSGEEDKEEVKVIHEFQNHPVKLIVDTFSRCSPFYNGRSNHHNRLLEKVSLNELESLSSDDLLLIKHKDEENNRNKRRHRECLIRHKYPLSKFEDLKKKPIVYYINTTHSNTSVKLSEKKSEKNHRRSKSVQHQISSPKQINELLSMNGTNPKKTVRRYSYTYNANDPISTTAPSSATSSRKPSKTTSGNHHRKLSVKNNFKRINFRRMTNRENSVSEDMEENKTKYECIDGFELREKIGTGAFARVMRAIHIITKEECAVKIMNRKKLMNDEVVEKIRREIRVLHELNHSNVAKLYRVALTKEDLYLFMEYMEGGELLTYISKHKKLSEKISFSFFRQLVDALDYCHQNNVVHRDLKLENVLLDKEYEKVKLVDFGLSNCLKDGEFFATSCGSPSYAAPEIVWGRIYSGPEVDYWSLGCILFAMLYGRLPFYAERGSVAKTFQRIRKGDYTIPPGTKDEICFVIKSLLTVDPSKRATAIDIRESQWYRSSICTPSSNFDDDTTVNVSQKNQLKKNSSKDDDEEENPEFCKCIIEDLRAILDRTGKRSSMVIVNTDAVDEIMRRLNIPVQEILDSLVESCDYEKTNKIRRLYDEINCRSIVSDKDKENCNTRNEKTFNEVCRRYIESFQNFYNAKPKSRLNSIDNDENVNEMNCQRKMKRRDSRCDHEIETNSSINMSVQPSIETSRFHQIKEEAVDIVSSKNVRHTWLSACGIGKWSLGLRSKADPTDIVLELMRVIKRINGEWKLLRINNNNNNNNNKNPRDLELTWAISLRRKVHGPDLMEFDKHTKFLYNKITEQMKSLQGDESREVYAKMNDANLWNEIVETSILQNLQALRFHIHSGQQIHPTNPEIENQKNISFNRDQSEMHEKNEEKKRNKLFHSFSEDSSRKSSKSIYCDLKEMKKLYIYITAQLYKVGSETYVVDLLHDTAISDKVKKANRLRERNNINSIKNRPLYASKFPNGMKAAAVIDDQVFDIPLKKVQLNDTKNIFTTKSRRMSMTISSTPINSGRRRLVSECTVAMTSPRTIDSKFFLNQNDSGSSSCHTSRHPSESQNSNKNQNLTALTQTTIRECKNNYINIETNDDDNQPGMDSALSTSVDSNPSSFVNPDNRNIINNEDKLNNKESIDTIRRNFRVSCGSSEDNERKLSACLTDSYDVNTFMENLKITNQQNIRRPLIDRLKRTQSECGPECVEEFLKNPLPKISDDEDLESKENHTSNIMNVNNNSNIKKQTTFDNDDNEEDDDERDDLFSTTHQMDLIRLRKQRLRQTRFRHNTLHMFMRGDSVQIDQDSLSTIQSSCTGSSQTDLRSDSRQSNLFPDNESNLHLLRDRQHFNGSKIPNGYYTTTHGRGEVAVKRRCDHGDEIRDLIPSLICYNDPHGDHSINNIDFLEFCGDIVYGLTHPVSTPSSSASPSTSKKIHRRR